MSPLHRIVLVRHGPSSHVQTGWIDAEGFRRWQAAYDAAGIRADARLPSALEPLAGRAGLVVASDTARTLETARLLAPGRDVVPSPLLRELHLESPALAGLRLPLGAWALAVGAGILLRKLRGRYPTAGEVERVHTAAAWLAELAGRHLVVVAVTHASVRGQLAARLAHAGWRTDPGRRSFRPWSAWGFSRPSPAGESLHGER